MKTQLKLASVALAVTGLVLSTCAVSLATVDDPPAMAVYYSESNVQECGASQILRITGDRTLIPEASLYLGCSSVEPEVASMGSGEQVLWGAGSPGGINADLGTKPWVAKATDLSGSGTATAATMPYPSWFVDNPELVHLTGLSDYYPGVAEYLSRLNAQQNVASRLPDNVSGGERVVPGIG